MAEPRLLLPEDELRTERPLGALLEELFFEYLLPEEDEREEPDFFDESREWSPKIDFLLDERS